MEKRASGQFNRLYGTKGGTNLAVTIRDVARDAGVSVATVSYVINGLKNITPETREKVMASVQQLDYHMNSAARSLAKRQTETVALLLPPSRSATDPFLMLFISGAMDAAAARGFGLLLTDTKAGGMESLVKSQAVDGIILMEAHSRDTRVPFLTRRGFPFVLFGRSPENPTIAALDVDNRFGAYSAVKYLTDMGHRRIAFIGADRRYFFSQDRYDGYTSAMADAGLERDPQLETSVGLTEVLGLQVARGFMALVEPPSAIFACSDLAAIGAQRAVFESGRTVPGDVSVVGYDGIPASEHTSPALTTVRQPIGELGTRAMSMLLDTIEDGPAPRELLLVKPELVVRSSTGRPPRRGDVA